MWTNVSFFISFSGKHVIDIQTNMILELVYCVKYQTLTYVEVLQTLEI